LVNIVVSPVRLIDEICLPGSRSTKTVFYSEVSPATGKRVEGS
jgi:hypothetical protein